MISPNDMRVSGFFGDEIVLGSFLWRMLPLFTALLFFKFGKTKQYEYFSVIVIFLVLVLAALSAERTSTAITLMFLFLHLFLIKKRKEFIIYPTIVLLVLTSFLLLGDSYAKKRLITITYQLSIGHYTLFFSKTHDSHIESAKKMFADNKLFGQGPNTFRKLCNKEKFYWDDLACSTHPHNTYMQFGAELGIVGLFFLFLAFIYLFVNVFLQFVKIYFKRDSHKTNYQMYLIFGLFLFLWPIAPSGNFFSSWLSNIHFITVGFYLHSISNLKKS